MTVSQEQFKQAMGSFPTGVTVTTAYSVAGEVVGMTGSACSSASLDPVLGLMCSAIASER